MRVGNASALPLEEVVRGAWVEAFDGPELPPVIAPEAVDHRDLSDEVDVLRERLSAATQSHFVDGVFRKPEYATVRRELEGRITDGERLCAVTPRRSGSRGWSVSPRRRGRRRRWSGGGCYCG